MSRFLTIEDVWSFLNAIPMFQAKGASAANFSLDNIRSFCEKLGNPQDSFPGIHVAGTNGKGTTCYLLEKIYSDAGYKTGLFTSPHLERYNERVRVNQNKISDQELLTFFQTADPLFDEIQLSYFEISTALAFWYFEKQKIDIAIIETGLGGRLDATNIIIPEVSVITSIGLDHQNVLGDTIEEIAREKAGIIKKNKPVVVGGITGQPLDEITAIARKRRATIYSAVEYKPEWESGKVKMSKSDSWIVTQLREPVNRWNIACVWLVTELLQNRLPVGKETLLKAISDFKGPPGRFEKLHSEFDWYFSGSHNEQALKSSIEALEQIKDTSETILVFSAMKDKLTEEVLAYFKGFKKAFFVEQEGERAAKYTDIKDSIQAELLDESRKEIILNELKSELVIFMGSFYFYPIVRRWTTNVS